MTPRRWIVSALLCLALVGIRLVHLSADSPPDVTTRSVALYVDEGYKTLGARNVLLFGSYRWHSEDDYPNWWYRSRVTQLAYYSAFRVLGPTLESARLVTIAWLALLLIGFVTAQRSRLSPALLWGGLLALGLQSALFFYSRVALLEIPVAVGVYLLALAFVALGEGRWLARTLLTLGVMVFVAFGMKRSGAVYLLPVLLAVAALPLIQRGVRRPMAFRAALAAVAVATGAVLLVTLETWVRRLDLSPLAVLDRALPSPALEGAPFAVLLGLLCALHGLACRPRQYLTHPYRASLLAVGLLSPLILAAFRYHPLRYYVPILPAYLLLIIEWLHLRSWTDRPAERLPRWGAGALLVLLIYVLFQAGGVLNRVASAALPTGPDEGLSSRLLLALFAGPAALATLAIARYRARLVTPPIVLGVACLLIGAFALRNAYQVGRFLAAPAYRALEIRADLTRLLPPAASIAGDWAPFFALGSDHRPIYVSGPYNATSLPRVAPDYFLYSAGGPSQRTLQTILSSPTMSLGPPLYRSQYIGREIVLYPLLHEEGAGAATQSSP